MRRGRFRPQPLARYVAAFGDGIAPAIQSRFYVSESLDFHDEEEGGEKFFRIIGTIQCEGGSRVEVAERLRFVPDAWWAPRGANRRVELVFYSYSAVLLNRGTIFRYDSPHPEHNRFHHVHRFDVLGSGQEIHLTEVREQDVPTIREVLKEAEDWHWAHLNG